MGKIEEYFLNPAISGSDLAGCRTPVEFYQRKFLHKPKEADYFDIGTAAHAYILQPDKFLNDIHVASDFPEKDNVNADGTYTKKGKNKSYFEEQKALYPDKIVFEPVVYNNVINYAESVKAIPGFTSLIDIEKGLPEYEVFGKDKETGLDLKGRIDYAKQGKFLTDLKFCRSISDRDLVNDFRDYEYHLRAAFYLDLYNQVTGENIDTFIYIMIEKSENPVARFLKMSEIDINAGREMYKERLFAIAECFKTNQWIANSIENYQLPDWAYNKQTNF